MLYRSHRFFCFLTGVSLITILVLNLSIVFAQPYLGFQSPASINVGYQFGNVSIFGGTDFHSLSLVTTSTTTRPPFNDYLISPDSILNIGRDWYPVQDVTASTVTSTRKSSVLYLSPVIGCKIKLNNNSIAPYFTFSVGKNIPIYVSGNNGNDDQLKDMYDDLFTKIGAGLDYLLNKSIMIGAEIGLHIQNDEYSNTFSESTLVTNISYTNQYKNLSMNSYSRITLIYFLK